ncbi:transposase (fragment) [Xenorhabdus nematophila ATCC 19061]|uniref:Transposase n=1 Tax=Xenorhabdus nematophila (strain ATCC 19061 / DSM 3370 / CCUG 14189 / LMG 1036 / NCIMB 9965 / AN6) TaxID=406817 RepID=D3VEP3_XENNA
MLATLKIHLTPEQKCPLELMHNTTRDSRVCDRIKAGLLAHEGLDSSEDCPRLAYS